MQNKLNYLVSKLSILLVIIWIISPLIETVSFFFLYESTWLKLLHTIGYTGCIIGWIQLLSSLYTIHQTKTSLKAYLLTHKIPIILFILYLLSYLSLFHSSNFMLSLLGSNYRNEGFLTYTSYVGIFVCAWNITNHQTIKRLWIFQALVACLVAIPLLLPVNPLLFSQLGITNISSLFYNSNHYGYYTCLAIGIIIALIITTRHYKAYFWLPALFIMSYTLTISNTLGSFLASLLGIIITIGYSIIYQPTLIRRLIIILGVFLIATTFASTTTSNIYHDLITLKQDVTAIVTGGNTSNAGTGRWKLWTTAIEFIKAEPLLGYGPDNLAEQYAQYGIIQERPHNEYLQIAVSLGLPALICYLSAIFLLFYDFLRLKTKASILHCSQILIVTIYLISAFFGNTMYYTTPFFLINLAILARLTKEKRSDDR